MFSSKGIPLTVDGWPTWQIGQSARLGALSLFLLLPIANTARGSDQAHEFGVGFGVDTPLTRPSLSISYGVALDSVNVATRAHFSFLNLTESFESAASSSQYANKLVVDTASLFDATFAVPEFSLKLPFSFYFSAAPSVRATLVRARYVTTADEPVTFSGLGIAAQPLVSAGYLFTLSSSTSLDFFTQLQMPVWSFGWSEMNYERDDSTAAPTLSDSDIDQMLESLQPYAQRLTQQFTAGAGLRLKYRF